MLKGLNKKKKALRKKVGDDKLVISLVLIAVGVVLCYVYRGEITSVVKSAATTLSSKITEMFNSNSVLMVVPKGFSNLFKF
ncbi:hypothetical protein GNF72_18610 [Clostridium perfringens]|nr:hypothetical protein [Clostridium perfringens]